MIVEVTRSHIKVSQAGRTVTIPGEMFFPSNDKIGFALAVPNTLFWDASDHQQMLTDEELQSIIIDIQAEFDRGGHILEVTSSPR